MNTLQAVCTTVTLAACAAFAAAAWADEPARSDASGSSFTPSQIEFFRQQVRPILRANCLKCHGGEPKIKGGLRLTSRANVLKGGDTSPAVTLDDPAASLLVEAIRYDGLEMPPKGKLPEEQIDVLTRWVEMGLPWTPGDSPADELEEEKSIPRVNDKTKSFWSFQPLRRPQPPLVQPSSWGNNEIDAFILARLQKAGLEPSPPAGKTALLRRAYYDLTGLPPSPPEVEAFVADDSPRAFQKVIDRLLASPHYGEKWARHWLDLVRYAETTSYERDSAKPFVWRYRDYVIQSLNDDMPYDQFVREQLAGDELGKITAERVIATYYYRLGTYQDDPVDPVEELYEDLDDIIRTTSEVFLGMTLGCARCHDHKLDPIPQRDYYRFLAFFHGINRYGTYDPKTVGHCLLPKIPPAEKHEQELCINEIGPKPRETFVLIRGNAHAHGEKVEPGFLSVLDVPDPAIPDAAEDAITSGRRRVLAEWIASADNPLTARVMVNRLWQYHFGRGIVPSPNNFGLKGMPPTHPELLDWLAAEFLQGGWRLKRMHKLMMLSAAYQMSSRANQAALAKDPENNWFWRYDMRRLTAEEVRDSILATGGSLNRQMFGPSIYPLIPAEVKAGQSKPGDGWGESSPEQRARRSVYVHTKRSLILPIIAAFDGADPDATCPVRFATTQPTQALGMFNGAFLNRQAKVLAGYLRTHAPGQPRGQIALALSRALQRTPTTSEIQRGVELLESLRHKDQLDAEQALDYYCLVVLNLNEFIYLD